MTNDQGLQLLARPTAIKARHWEILANDESWNAIGGIYGWTMFEMELFASSDATGSDQTLGKLATSSSVNTTFVPALMIDDNPVTWWSSETFEPTPPWYRVDFGVDV